NRRVPVHPELVALGFVAFVEQQRAAGCVRLFPELRADKHTGKVTRLWGKTWNWYARKTCGITDPRKTFHSFRHGWIDAAREVMQEAHRHAITGHAGGGVGRQYGRGVSLTKLAESMGRVRYPGLNLGHLYRAKEGT